MVLEVLDTLGKARSACANRESELPSLGLTRREDHAETWALPEDSKPRRGVRHGEVVGGGGSACRGAENRYMAPVTEVYADSHSDCKVAARTLKKRHNVGS